jgi:pyruvate dehydrogenase E2 component (dihydrolipoamide acetyltransferase)
MASDTVLCDITLPSFGSSVGGATLVQWHTREGDTVEAGQIIADIETDKAVTELEAPQSGVVETILVPEGSEDVEVGSILARLRVPGNGAGPPVTSATTELVLIEPSTNEAATALAPPGAAQEPTARISASPYARSLARELHQDLGDIVGSGPNGRIVSRDLSQAARQADAKAPSLPADDGHAPDDYTLEPISRMRRAIATGLLRSVREIPAYSLVADIELDAALHHRRSLNKTSVPDAVRISLNDVVVWACARSLREVPEANSAWTDGGIARFRHANIAIAVATDGGLFAPIVRAADAMSLVEIAEESHRLVLRARERQLTNAELRGATFTVSNLGMLGIRAFTSIPGPMQGCILSVGAAAARPVVLDGAVTTATQASFTLTCDHRVIDGAVGARFLQKLGEILGEF